MPSPTLQEAFGFLLEENLLSEIKTYGIVKTFSKDDVIIDIGQPMPYVPLLLSGTVKILREDTDGNELLIYFLESGDTCAMSLTCCMSKSKSKIRAVADTDSNIILIPTEKMEDWFNRYPSWRNFVLQSYQLRFNEMLETIDTLAFMNMDERLYKYLTDKVKLNGSTTVLNTHQQIAEDLHTSRVVVSRLLKQLENQHKIKLSRNKIEVLNF